MGLSGVNVWQLLLVVGALAVGVVLGRWYAQRRQRR